eukprot:56164-Chlamydomonas_euryale.AAC.11
MYHFVIAGSLSARGTIDSQAEVLLGRVCLRKELVSPGSAAHKVVGRGAVGQQAQRTWIVACPGLSKPARSSWAVCHSTRDRFTLSGVVHIPSDPPPLPMDPPACKEKAVHTASLSVSDGCQGRQLSPPTPLHVGPP